MNIFKRIGRIISSAANIMSCAQGICFKPEADPDRSIDDLAAFGRADEASERLGQQKGSVSLRRE